MTLRSDTGADTGADTGQKSGQLRADTGAEIRIFIWTFIRRKV